MTTYNFQSYPVSVKETFDCPRCLKTKRTRTFRAECTVNPFNKNEDGSIKSPFEVRKQSQENAMDEAAKFLRSPICAACENQLSYAELKELRRTRKQVDAHHPLNDQS